MSKPRPIHTLHRDLRQSPDEEEPSFSYEEHIFDGYEDDEDKFHRRLQSTSHRRDSNEQRGSGSTASFWRTSLNNSETSAATAAAANSNISGSPALQSMNISSGGGADNTAAMSPSLLTQALNQRETPGSGKKKNNPASSPQQVCMCACVCVKFIIARGEVCCLCHVFGCLHLMRKRSHCSDRVAGW